MKSKENTGYGLILLSEGKALPPTAKTLLADTPWDFSGKGYSIWPRNPFYKDKCSDLGCHEHIDRSMGVLLSG